MGQIEATVLYSIPSKQETKDASDQCQYRDKCLKETKSPYRHHEPSSVAIKAKTDQSTANHREQPAKALLWKY
jgi:hypothetical protein